jgi:hypothetical protein
MADSAVYPRERASAMSPRKLSLADQSDACERET